MDIDQLLQLVLDRRASDLHLDVMSPPVIRVDGALAFLDSMPPLTAEDVTRLLGQVTTEEQRAVFDRELELDFAYTIPEVARFRVNACVQRGTISLAFRPIPTTPFTIEELGLPEACRTLALLPKGLVMVSGPTGCGKSTTLAAMIDYLNRTERRRIVCIEDPIEFLYQNKKCLISQRELGVDTSSFALAVRQSLRQDPDVVLVGEMRDLDTASAVLTAAETGHLVFSTGHAPSAPQTIERIIHLFPPQQQHQERIRLATVIEGIFCQMLVPRADAQGRIAAVEVMLATSAVRNIVREEKLHQLPGIVQTGAQYGMQTLDQALSKLCLSGLIAKEEALARASDREEMANRLGSLKNQGANGAAQPKNGQEYNNSEFCALRFNSSKP